MLEYQYSSFSVFVLDYVLKIMDDNIKTFELKSNEYILLDSDSYKIIQ